MGSPGKKTKRKLNLYSIVPYCAYCGKKKVDTKIKSI